MNFSPTYVHPPDAKNDTSIVSLLDVTLGITTIPVQSLKYIFNSWSPVPQYDIQGVHMAITATWT